ncbi:MAG TPA: S-adenosylmethionine decarboxylase [Candidatus Acidoferrum sp.]|nr:S-adenosylmethionine decarboxylase [Candidatus Acidoferrum sp.]
MNAIDSYKRIVIDGQRYYGRHLIASAHGCNDALLDKDTIARFLKEMTQRIDMVAFGEPFVERFGGGIEVGISGVQLIETSAITLHTNDGARDLYLDVFSCKDFSAQEALAVVREYFAPATVTHQELLRR